jgi:hypothetical protein
MGCQHGDAEKSLQQLASEKVIYSDLGHDVFSEVEIGDAIEYLD